MYVRNVLRRAGRIFSVGLQRVNLYRIRNDNPPPTLPPVSGAHVFLLDPEQVHLLRELQPANDLRELERRLREGSSCYCATHSGHLAHYTWVQTSGQHWIMRAGRREKVSAGQFWVYDCRTSHAARGKGIYPFILSLVVRDHFNRGLQEGLIYTTPQNVASQRGILKAGFQYYETLSSVRIGHHYLAMGKSERLRDF